MQHTIEVASEGASKIGALTAAGSGMGGLFRLTPDEWSIIGVIGGFIIGIAGVTINAWIRWLEHKDRSRHRLLQLELQKQANKPDE